MADQTNSSALLLEDYVAELERKVVKLTDRVVLLDRRLTATIEVVSRQVTEDVLDRLRRALDD